jgi:hypothetical protein
MRSRGWMGKGEVETEMMKIPIGISLTGFLAYIHWRDVYLFSSEHKLVLTSSTTLHWTGSVANIMLLLLLSSSSSSSSPTRKVLSMLHQYPRLQAYLIILDIYEHPFRPSGKTPISSIHFRFAFNPCDSIAQPTTFSIETDSPTGTYSKFSPESESPMFCPRSPSSCTTTWRR